MHRIDHVTAVASRPAVIAPGTPGFFTAGDPLAGQEATWVTHDWCNDVQETLCTAIEGAGIALAKGEADQLLRAIRVIAAQAGGMPVGVPFPWLGATSTIPANCVILMGQTLPRASYPAITAHALASGMIVSDSDWLAYQVHRTKFSRGDGATTIRLPDLRGEAIYGADLGRGVRSAGVGDWLSDELKTHVHPATSEAAGNHNHGGQTAAGGEHGHDYVGVNEADNPDTEGAADGASNVNINQLFTKQTSVAPPHIHGIPLDGLHSHIVNVLAAGGGETRQRGVGYPFIMRVI